MCEEKEEKEKKYNVLVYGIRKIELTAPSEPIVSRNFSIFFKPYNTDSRFNEYDGVVLFQGIFESFEWKYRYDTKYLNHSWDKDELDKRKKEAQLLIENGGFLCFLLNKKFIDQNDYSHDISGSDLAKYHLHYENFYRKTFNQRITNVVIKLDDFKKFLSVYGAAFNYFYNDNENIEWRIIATASGEVAGMVINRNQYFIPTLIPDNRLNTIEDYFISLVEALTSSYNKLQKTLPDWIEKFTFDEEAELSTEHEELENRIIEIENRRNVLSRYKSILANSSDELVASVRDVFANGFGIAVNIKDEFREDLILLDDSSKPVCLCEVKGTNRGAKREHINQVDSHRDRSKYDNKFPALLIINTHIKNARSVIEKDKEIANEQIIHAAKMNVLILRTIDLLGLLKLYLNCKLKLDEVKKLFTNNTGWLRVCENHYTIVSGNIPEGNA